MNPSIHLSLAAAESMRMRSHDSRPLEEKLMTPIHLFLSDLVIQIAVLEAQTIELTEVPGEKR